MVNTNKISQAHYQSVKLAVALRTGRSVVGWSQDELSKLSGILKITIARFETLEGDGFSLTVEGRTINLAGERLGDNNRRRADRKKRRGVF